MSAFIRRFTTFPSVAELTAIEAVNIVDLTPQAMFLGVGSGTLLTLGEFEDGPFITGGDASQYANPTEIAGIAGASSQSIIEVFGDTDMQQKFGGFGFSYSGTPYSNPCARRHMGEIWNGNGFMKLKGFRGSRLMIGRVDTSVGNVSMFPLAAIDGTIRGPFQLTAGLQLSLTTNVGGPALSTALAAVAATVAGAGFAASGFVGGEQINVTIDGGSVVTVTFTAADQTPAQVVARINQYVGAPTAIDTTGDFSMNGFVRGTNGSLVLADVTPGALAAIGHVAATTAGTGNVGNIDSVSATELATIINAAAALIAISAKAAVTTDGRLRVYSSSTASGSIDVAAGTIQAATGLSTDAVLAGAHTGGVIPAGTRVRTAGGLEWVTMQSLTVPSGETTPTTTPSVVKVRPATDDGSAVGTGATTVTTLVVQPSFALFAVSNGAVLTAAKTEPQIDALYTAALAVTLSITAPSRTANFMISARRSPVVVTAARQTAIDASEQGCFGRKLITRAPLTSGSSASIADVAQYRSDRVYYTTIPFKLYSPEIATRGAAGGTGFTENGVIEVGGETALATLCCTLAPEEDPGQQTDLLGAWIGLGDIANAYSIETYTAFRAAGICAPRSDTFATGLFFQSGVTSSLEVGRTEIQRRDMADFVQDSCAILGLPYSKRNPTLQIKSSFLGDIDGFLLGLLSPDTPEKQRIRAYSVTEAPLTAAEQGMGIFRVLVKVLTFSSMKFIEIPVEIGASVTITDLAA